MQGAPLFLSLGQVVAGGRYRLVAELGRGGFGVVYRAEQLALRREVALKVLLPTMRDPERALARFRREAELAQRLEHPNTVRVYDFGQLETGQWFIALELLRGMTLDAALRSGPLSPSRAARIIVQIGKSLMEAHARGVVHRDLKPQNVFLCDFSGETDFVKVLDFGVAKVHDEDDGKPVTQGGQVVGTPAYMAPEQVTGGAITPATDLYALGLVLAECVTGRPVVVASTSMQACMMQASPAPLALPPGLAASAFAPIVARAVQKNPALRYGSAEELVADIERVGIMGSNDTAVATVSLGASHPRATAPMQAVPVPTPLVPPAYQGPSYAPAALAPTVGLSSQTSAMNVSQPTLSGSGAVTMSRGAFATILALAGLLVLVTAGGTGLYFYGRESARSADSPPSTSTPKNAPHAGKIGTLDVAAVKTHLEKAGYTVNGPFTNAAPGFKVESLSFVDAHGGGGQVQLMEYDSDMSVDIVETTVRDSRNAAYVREGHRVFVVYCATKAESDRVFPIALAK